MIALILTILVEFFPVFFLMHKERGTGIILFSVIAVNLLTNPIANQLYPEIGFWEIEGGVILAEALLFALLLELRLGKGIMISLAANIPTIILSLFLFFLGTGMFP